MLRKNRVFRTSASSRSIVLLRKTTPPAVLHPLVHFHLQFLHNTVLFNIIKGISGNAIFRDALKKLRCDDAKSIGTNPP